jgi:uncharacterized protein YwgA
MLGFYMPKSKIENSKDLLLILLYAPGIKANCDPIQGQTRLMKMIFLFKKELQKKFNFNHILGEDAFPDFTAYDYGPYSGKVYEDLEFLVNIGFVQVRKNGQIEVTEEEKREFDYWTATSSSNDELNTDILGREFTLTSIGKGFVEEELWPKLSDNQKNIITEFKKRCTTTSLRSLLRYVYTKYEDMTTKSVIKDEILS